MEWRITQTYETMDLDIDYEYQRKSVLNYPQWLGRKLLLLCDAGKYLRRGVKTLKC